jgi:ribonuclease HI
MEIPVEGIATDAAHSTKNRLTSFRGVELLNNKEIFLNHIGNKTVNIGEFLGVVATVKYILENNYTPVIYTDSTTAIAWFNNMKTASKKTYAELEKAEVFLKIMSERVKHIRVLHWDNNLWGKTPADFGNK